MLKGGSSAAKRRHVSREAEVSSSSGPEVDNDEPIDSVVCAGTKRTISMQTELTMTEMTALQLDNQSRQEVVSSGHPTREQLYRKTKTF